MANWIEQTSGAHVDAVRDTIEKYKSGALTIDRAWEKLSSLYEISQGRKCDADLNTHRERGQASVDYMITIWFERYANSWAWPLYQGKRESFSYYSERLTKELARLHGGEFQMMYEY